MPRSVALRSPALRVPRGCKESLKTRTPLRLSAAPHNSRPQEDKVGRASDALQNTMKMSGRGDSVWTQARLRLVDAFRVMDKDGRLAAAPSVGKSYITRLETLA